MGSMGEVQSNDFSCLTTGDNILRIVWFVFFFHCSMWFLSISFTKPSFTGIGVNKKSIWIKSWILVSQCVLSH